MAVEVSGIQPLGVETVKENTGKPLKLWARVGWDGAFVLCFMYTLAGVHLYLAFLYTNKFRSFARGPAFIFFFFACLNFCVPCMLLATSRTVFRSIQQQQQQQQQQQHAEGGKDKSCPHLCYAHWKSTRIHQPRFLWKLYASEMASCILQLINLRTIYLCALPGWIVAPLSFLFMLESTMRVYFLNHTLNTKVRTFAVAMDTALDLLDTVVPLVALRSLGILIALSEILQVITWPSIAMAMKSRSIFRDILRRRSAENIVRVRSLDSMTLDDPELDHDQTQRTRSTYHEMAKIQQAAIPAVVRKAMTMVTIAHALVMALVGVLSIVGHSVAADKCATTNGGLYIWKNCIVKAPICNNVFVPDCNCAVIKVHNHNMTRLPIVVNLMTALRKVEVVNGPLRVLDDDFGSQAPKLSVLIMDFNRLKSFPDGISKMASLHTLYMGFNEIEYIPSGLWTLPELYDLDLQDNRIGTAFEEVRIGLPNLHHMHLSNNSIAKLPKVWVSPSLTMLHAGGNNISTIPHYFSSFTNLQILYLSRNQFNSTSFEVGFDTLNVLDVQNNSLRSFPLWFGSVRFLYAAGNPICAGNSATSCAPQCSEYCNDYLLQNADRCDFECNSKVCNFHNGRCSL